MTTGGTTGAGPDYPYFYCNYNRAPQLSARRRPSKEMAHERGDIVTTGGDTDDQVAAVDAIDPASFIENTIFLHSPGENLGIIGIKRRTI